MRVFLAGGTGAIGRQLLPMLVGCGYEVICMTRSPSKAPSIRQAGGEPVVADALDGGAIEAAVRAAQPDVVVHQLTAIPPVVDPRRFAEDFGPTNQLRREGTRNLMVAARKAKATRFLAQSIAQAYAPVGGWIKSEDDPLYSDPPPVFRDVFRAVIDLEETVIGEAELEGIVLRYGNYYGPGTAYAADGSNAGLVRRQRFPIAGAGAAHWSFIHVADAARATVTAVARGEPGVYNIVDDEPAAVSDWLPAYAAALGAPAPPRVSSPTSPYGAFGMLHARAASNAKARERLGWTPQHASWRDGFPAELA